MQNRKFDIKKAGFMRTASIFSNIQLSNSRAVVLDEYVRKQLYLHPAAWEFFGAFDGYVGNQGLEYDATEKICKSFGVKKCLTE